MMFVDRLLLWTGLKSAVSVNFLAEERIPDLPVHNAWKSMLFQVLALVD